MNITLTRKFEQLGGLYIFQKPDRRMEILSLHIKEQHSLYNN